jgi:hypothetical protein
MMMQLRTWTMGALVNALVPLDGAAPRGAHRGGTIMLQEGRGRVEDRPADR